MGCGKKPWVPLIGVTGYISYASALVTRQLGGIQSIPRTVGLAQFIGVYKGAYNEMLESIKHDWGSLVLVKKEIGVRNPTVSEKYPEWRNGGVIYVTEVSEPVGIRRKRVNCEEELREQVKLLQAELKTKEEQRVSLEQQLAKERAVRKTVEEEKDSVGQDWIKATDDLKTINKDMTYYMAKAKHWEELAIKTQAALKMRRADVVKLKDQLGRAEIEIVNTKHVTKIHEELRVELNDHKTEAEALRSKLDKEKLKTAHLMKSQKMIEQHNQTLDAANNFLSRNNLIHTERIRELQDQVDQAAAEAYLLRVEARQVGGDIIKYRRSLDNTDLFLKAIANRGSVFSPVID